MWPPQKKNWGLAGNPKSDRTNIYKRDREFAVHNRVCRTPRPKSAIGVTNIALHVGGAKSARGLPEMMGCVDHSRRIVYKSLGKHIVYKSLGGTRARKGADADFIINYTILGAPDEGQALK